VAPTITLKTNSKCFAARHSPSDAECLRRLRRPCRQAWAAFSFIRLLIARFQFDRNPLLVTCRCFIGLTYRPSVHSISDAITPRQHEHNWRRRPSVGTECASGRWSLRRLGDGAAGLVVNDIVEWFYDKAVRGADAITERPGFAAILDRVAGNGIRTIIVESPDRFARDLAVQLAGHDHLRGLGVTLIPATAPDFFTEDTPTAVLVRQVLGAIAQFDKATTVAKLKAARDRKIAVGEKCGGRKSYAEARPGMVELARQLRRPDRDRRPISLRKVSAALAERGYVASTGRPYQAAAVAAMLRQVGG